MSENSLKKIKWRKSNAKDDSLLVAEEIANKHKIDPYTQEELSDVIRAGVRANEIALEKEKGSYYLKDVEKWFTHRLIPNTIVLTKEDYMKALYRAFRLLVLANIAMTDFGSSRQRDFGQRWTDFTRGFLGEIGIEKFFKEKLGLIVDLEEKKIGNVEEFLPTDITKIKEKGKWREAEVLTSIKTSKLGSMWLDIGTQLPHSDAFIFIKIGLTVDHLLHFFKDNSFLKDLVDIGKKLNEVDDVKKELEELRNCISDVKPFPTYISGFVWKEDMQKGELEIHETSRGNKTIVGGLGLFTGELTKNFEGLGELTPPKHMACLGSLRWSKTDWKKLKDKI
ncbi:MAG TPA: hypothetical protein VMV95_02565 [Bacillota bacterium]|nr:hypothetical protein [Bacillota bacterium]